MAYIFVDSTQSELSAKVTFVAENINVSNKALAAVLRNEEYTKIIINISYPIPA